jgi:hypothetical protein
MGYPFYSTGSRTAFHWQVGQWGRRRPGADGTVRQRPGGCRRSPDCQWQCQPEDPPPGGVHTGPGPKVGKGTQPETGSKEGPPRAGPPTGPAGPSPRRASPLALAETQTRVTRSLACMPLALRPPVLLSSSKHRRPGGRPADSGGLGSRRAAPSRDVSHDVHPPTSGVAQTGVMLDGR